MLNNTILKLLNLLII